jgi:hypothetical protein
MPEYDPTRDIAPPLSQYADDILVDDVGPGGLGRGVPFWKVLLHRTLATRLRADSAARPSNKTAASALPDEKKPPPLAADSAKAEFADAVAALKRRKYYADLYAKCDELEARCDALLVKERS